MERPRCSLLDEWRDRTRSLRTVAHCSATKGSEPLTPATPGTKPDTAGHVSSNPLVETSGIRHIHRGSKRVVVAKGRREEAVRRDGWWLRSRRLGRRRRCAVLETGFLGRRANRACAAAALGPVPLRGAAPCRPHSSGAGRHPPVASPARTDGLGVGHLAETAASRRD